MTWTLGVDFGTSNTAAAYRVDGGPAQPVRLSDQAEQMPSAILALDSGIMVGGAAVRSARLDPQRFEPSPKRRLGEGEILLGAREWPVTQLIAEVLAHVRQKALWVAGGQPPQQLVLTFPQEWAQGRKDQLRQAAARAGYDPATVRLVTEPIAAATWYASTQPVPAGKCVAVFDFGGGTCDVAVLRSNPDEPGTFTVLAADGIDPLGGELLDLRLLEWTLGQLSAGGNQDMVDSLSAPENLGALLTLREQVRHAKHELAEYESARIPVAVGSVQSVVTITSAEFDKVVGSEIDEALKLTRRALVASEVAPADLHALYLTGGSSHLRLVHRKMTELLGRPPATLNDPKLVVAQGALLVPPGALEALEAREATAQTGAQPVVATTQPQPSMPPLHPTQPLPRPPVPTGPPTGPFTGPGTGPQIRSAPSLPPAKSSAPTQQQPFLPSRGQPSQPQPSQPSQSPLLQPSQSQPSQSQPLQSPPSQPPPSQPQPTQMRPSQLQPFPPQPPNVAPQGIQRPNHQPPQPPKVAGPSGFVGPPQLRPAGYQPSPTRPAKRKPTWLIPAIAALVVAIIATIVVVIVRNNSEDTVTPITPGGTTAVQTTTEVTGETTECADASCGYGAYQRCPNGVTVALDTACPTEEQVTCWDETKALPGQCPNLVGQSALEWVFPVIDEWSRTCELFTQDPYPGEIEVYRCTVDKLPQTIIYLSRWDSSASAQAEYKGQFGDPTDFVLTTDGDTGSALQWSGPIQLNNSDNTAKEPAAARVVVYKDSPFSMLLYFLDPDGVGKTSQETWDKDQRFETPDEISSMGTLPS